MIQISIITIFPNSEKFPKKFSSACRSTYFFLTNYFTVFNAKEKERKDYRLSDIICFIFYCVKKRKKGHFEECRVLKTISLHFSFDFSYENPILSYRNSYRTQTGILGVFVLIVFM